jgi:hypothetical protein
LRNRGQEIKDAIFKELAGNHMIPFAPYRKTAPSIFEMFPRSVNVGGVIGSTPTNSLRPNYSKVAIASDGICIAKSTNTFSITNLSANLWEVQYLKDLTTLVTNPTDTTAMRIRKAELRVHCNHTSIATTPKDVIGSWIIFIVKMKNGGTFSTTEGNGSFQDVLKAAVNTDYRYEVLSILEPVPQMEMADSSNYCRVGYVSESHIDLTKVMQQICNIREARETMTSEATMPTYLLGAAWRGADDGGSHYIKTVLTYHKETKNLT